MLELFLDELADIYNAERQLVEALPKMAQAARSSELREAFESHLDETTNQVRRLEQVAASVEATLQSNQCEAMEGLLKEGQEMMEEYDGKPTLDAALIAAAQKVEHYEIATYGTLAAWARQMGHEDALALLEETMEEEKAADEKLTELGESQANLEIDDER